MGKVVPDGEFCTLANAAPVLMWRSRPGSGRDFVNSAWLSFTGRKVGQELGWGWIEGVEPDDRPRCRTAHTAAFEAGVPFELDYRLRRRDGTYRWVTDRAAPMIERGKILGFSGVSIDTTPARDADLAHQLIEGRLLTIIEALEEGVVAHSPRDGTGFANRAFRRMFGPDDPAKAIFSNLQEALSAYELLDAQHRPLPAEERPMWRVLRGERLEGLTARARFPDGRLLDVSYRGEPIFDDTGAVKLAVLVVRDLTEQKRAAVELQSLQHELIHVSRVSAMSSIASAVAHELNQPLTAISNYAAAARRLAPEGSDGKDRISDLLSRIGDSALLAGKLVRRLGDMVRKSTPNRVEESLTEIIDNAVALTLADPVQRSLLRLRIDAGAERVVGDRIEIQQVLVNLIRNALEAMESSSVKQLEIGGAPIDDDMVMVSVGDTGGGLSDEARRYLFLPFNTTKAEGMGVGLSICRTIIEAHGGRLWAEDRPGGGTVFRFTLPRAERSDGSEAD